MLSIMAGVSLGSLSDTLRVPKLVRAMPNLPGSDWHGHDCIYLQPGFVSQGIIYYPEPAECHW
jgi:pyrroline-5-carboxylate reductase